MTKEDHDILAIRGWAGNAALRIVKEYGVEAAPGLIAEAADAFIRALGAVAGPREARDRLEASLGAIPPRTGEKPKLVVSN